MRGILLSAAFVLLSGCTHDRTPSPEPATPLFREVASETGLNFQHFIGATGEFYMPEIMGAGVALLDYDNDGDLDIYVLQGTTLNPGGKLTFPKPAGQPSGNRLFRNDLIPTGKLHFTDVTDTAGVGYSGYGMGVATGDYDNDGFVDLYITNFGHNVLFHNNGNGTFTDVTRAAGVDDPRWSTSATFLDYDRDGDLDLFVLNYLDFHTAGNKKCYGPTGELDYCSPRAYSGVPSKLFRNDGGGRFTDVSVKAGITAAYGPGLGVVAADFNGDGWIDLYVANDGAPNILWLNRKDGTFENTALMAGAAYDDDGSPKAGMGVAAGDFDNNGSEDLIVLNLLREGCSVLRNNGKGEFQDVALRLKLGSATFPYTGFGVGWFDYDNDGRLDLFLANGAVTVLEQLRGKPYPFQQPNLLLRNGGEDGFSDVSGLAGPALALKEVSRGAAFGDIDNDGDIDIVVSNNNGPLRLLLNDGGSRQAWLEVSLRGTRDNRQALGARLAVLREGKPTLWRRVHTDSSYLSASDPRVHFGLGSSTKAVDLMVVWPGGQTEYWQKLSTGTQHTIQQGQGRPNAK